MTCQGHAVGRWRTDDWDVEKQLEGEQRPAQSEWLPAEDMVWKKSTMTSPPPGSSNPPLPAERSQSPHHICPLSTRLNPADQGQLLEDDWSEDPRQL